jgi:hypothetical protein
MSLIAIAKIATKIRIGNILSKNNEERKESSLYSTSSTVVHVRAIHISAKDVSKGFFVVNTL